MIQCSVNQCLLSHKPWRRNIYMAFSWHMIHNSNWNNKIITNYETNQQQTRKNKAFITITWHKNRALSRKTTEKPAQRDRCILSQCTFCHTQFFHKDWNSSRNTRPKQHVTAIPLGLFNSFSPSAAFIPLPFHFKAQRCWAMSHTKPCTSN